MAMLSFPRSPALAGAGLVVLCFATPAWAGGPPFRERPGEMEFSGRLIARVRHDLAPQREADARARLAPTRISHIDDTDEDLLGVPGARGVQGQARGTPENSLAADLLATGDYEYVHPDWLCYPQATTPSDPLLGLQWHHARVGSSAAWDLATGSSSVTVALVDTGIDLTHPELAPHRVSGYNSVWHLAETAGGPVADLNGHGTHTSGCAAAVGNNGVGVAGMGWALSIMMIRTSNDASGVAYLSDMLDGARWAANKGARVVSISYSGVESDAVQTTGAYVRAKNGLLFFAADNTGTDHSDFDWPDVVVVGATDQTDGRAWYSSYGTAVDVFAPGSSIYSTKRGGGYEYRDGTSMATPLAAGLAGVLWSVSSSYTSQQVEAMIEGTCVDLGAPGNDGVFGWGRIDAFGAVKSAVGALGPHAPSALPDSGTARSGIPTILPVLDNDYDVNGDPINLTLLTVEYSAHGATIQASRGTGQGGNDQIVYTAPAGFVGTDVFSYTVVDSTKRTATATVTVEVLPACVADVNTDGFVNALDLDLFEGWFEASDGRADLNHDRFVNGDDFDLFLTAYSAGC